MNEIAWAMLAAVLVIVPLFAYLITKRYADPDDSDKLTTATTTLGLTLSLLTLFLVPVDIYLVSGNIDEFGFQKDLDATNSAVSTMKTLYYIVYATLLAMAFAVMPFVYFYFEEEEEDSTVRSRAMGALKYTTLFVIVFAVLIGLGVVLKNGQFKNADQGNYVDNLKNSFGAGESILTFCISCLALLGLFGWIAYAAYGLAAFPISLMRTFDTVERPSGYSRESQEDIELKLRKTEAELKFLTSRYQLGTEQMTPSDKKQLQHLKREQTRLQSIIERRSGRGAAAKAGAVKDWFTTIWNATAPLRIIVGLVLLGLSLLIVISYMLSAIDRAVHSECKWSCAFTVEKSSLPNPVDLALKKFSSAFPVDYIAFGGIVLYIFLCSVGAMVVIGIRLLCWQLYTVEPKKTMPHGLIMGAWLLMFMVLLMNMEVMTLAPRYTTFGNQFYLSANNDTITKEECSTAIYASSNHTLCVPTQVSRFIQSTDLAMPFFGVIFYMANYLFFFAFFVSLVASIFYRPKATSYEKMKDDSLLRDEF